MFGAGRPKKVVEEPKPKKTAAKAKAAPKAKAAKVPKEPKAKAAKVPKEPKAKAAKVPKEPKAKAAKKVASPKDDGKRTFTICSVNSRPVEDGGRFKSTTPLAAAKKAARRAHIESQSDSVDFDIRETTRGSDKKEYGYTSSKVLLAKPKVIAIKGAEPYEILYEYKVASRSD